MGCTTILVGKNASYDGSTLMARNEDSASGKFNSKKWIAVSPKEQPRLYRSVISKVEIPLPENPVRYTAVPNALNKDGIWGEAGFNEYNVAMSETETLTSNPRVLGADPLVDGGIGEEDMLTIVLPYIKSAREGVLLLGSLLAQYGTYEMNGIGFQDMDEVWWLESIGGHHWMAKKVPDNAYVVVPNQQGIDHFDFTDAYGAKKENLCSPDLAEWVRENHLNPAMEQEKIEEITDFDVRGAFGSRSDADHVYNTPRAWFMERFLNPGTCIWDGPDAEYGPESDDLPWSLVPERRITIEDIKYVLSSYYQGTDYDPYSRHADPKKKGMYRPIGINRNNFVMITQLRPYVPKELAAVSWMSMGCNAFNTTVPFYGNVTAIPEYFSDTTARVTTENFYWVNRIIAALADAHFSECIPFVERYQLKTSSDGYAAMKETDRAFLENRPEDACSYLEECNQKSADRLKKDTEELLNQVLYTASMEMTSAYSRSDN